MKTTFQLTLHDDEVTRGRLLFLNRLEAAFDDPRNPLPPSYFWFTEELPLGASIQVTLELVQPAKEAT